MTDIFMAIGVSVFLFFITFFIPFIADIYSDRDRPSQKDDFVAIFILAWIIAVLIAAVTLCSCLSMQKKLDKYEKQVRMVEPHESEGKE